MSRTEIPDVDDPEVIIDRYQLINVFVKIPPEEVEEEDITGFRVRLA